MKYSVNKTNYFKLIEQSFLTLSLPLKFLLLLYIYINCPLNIYFKKQLDLKIKAAIANNS